MNDEVDFYLAGYPAQIASIGRELRRIVLRAVPDVQERVRSGWALIGYDVPLGRRTRYFAFIAPERRHIHLGFEYGAWMADIDGVLEGAEIGLKKVRFVTFGPGARLDEAGLIELTRDAARVARQSRSERLAVALDR